MLITPNVFARRRFFNLSSRSKGFSLLEIMIVITLLAILMRMAVPNFTEARRRAKLHACCRNLISLATAISIMEVETGPICRGIKTRQQKLFKDTEMGRQLIKRGYLRALPVCPEAGDQYSIELLPNNYPVVPEHLAITQPGTWKMYCTSKLHAPYKDPHYYSWYGLVVK